MKSVVLLSGGIDSAVAAAMEKESGAEVSALWLFHGQRTAEKERLAARAVSDHLGISLTVIQIAGTGADEAKLTGSGTVVPVRNLIFIAFAANHAQRTGALQVVIGSHMGDFALFPDCRPEFVAAVNETLYQSGCGVRVVAPLHAMTKPKVVAEGRRLGVPLGLTWSCYAGGAEPCGTCLACTEREKALFEGRELLNLQL